MRKDIKVIALEDIKKLDPKLTQPEIVLGDHISSQEVLSLCVDHNIQHIVQYSNSDSSAEIKLSSHMITQPADFLQFPLSMILGQEFPSKEIEMGLSGVSLHLSVPDDKHVALERLEVYLAQFTNSTSLIYDIRLACDELITNSIYNAPYVDIDNINRNPTRDPNQIVIDPNKKPYFFAGSDGQQFVVGCTDFYGRLNVQKFVEHIKNCYQSNQGQNINFGPGGAGIGSFMIFDSCARLYIAVAPGQSTSFTCVFPLKMSAQARLNIPKNLHITQIDTET